MAVKNDVAVLHMKDFSELQAQLLAVRDYVGTSHEMDVKSVHDKLKPSWKV